MREQIRAMRERRATINSDVNEAIGVINNAGASDNDRNEARQRADRGLADMARLKDDIDRMESALQAQVEQDAMIAERAEETGRSRDQQEDIEASQDRVFRNYIVNGLTSLSPDDREIFDSMRTNLPQGAQTTESGAGGITIPTITQNGIETAMAAFGGLRSVATVLRTGNGRTLVMPTANDTARKGRRINEAAAAPQGAGVPFSYVDLGAYIYTSDSEPISIPLIEDSAVDMATYIGDRLGERLYRAQAADFVHADGNDKPRGIVTAAQAGVNAATAAGLSYADLINLEYAVDAAYRKRGGFLISDGAEKTLRLLEDNDGRPLWQPGIAVNAPDTINGRPYTVDFELDDPGADNVSMMFGRLDKYHIREVRDMTLMVLREKYAENYLVGLIAFQRADGDLLDAGTGCVAKLTHPGA